MHRCLSSRGRWVSLSVGLLGWLAAAGSPLSARAQFVPGDSIPSRMYFGTQALHFDGDYRDAAAAFAAESRGGIKSPAGLWIDSICYFTMAGESCYQLGQLPAALANYNEALKLYVANFGWMLRVQFPPAIMPATVGMIRGVPWGQSKRGASLGQFPDTFTMGQGQIDNSAAVLQGGVIQAPVLFPVNVAEIVRCTSLAIRRRRELLGPLCKHDPLTGDLVDVLARRSGPPNHWSEAWINVQLGCAYAAAGNVAQAKTALERGVLAGGQFDHPLTSTALLELGLLSLDTGDFAVAQRYFEEASYACVNYPNAGNLEEAFRYGFLAHLLLNQKTSYPPLSPAIAWAKTQGYRQLQTSLLLLAGENMLTLGETEQAANWLSQARAVVGRSDLALSQTGARLNHLAAMVAYQSGNLGAGDSALAAALAFQEHGSLWMFQIQLTDDRYTNGDLTSDRVAMLLYEATLRDPTPADWVSSPLECLSMLCTPHGAAIEHWFEIALKSSRELGLEVADRARRHRFFSTLPVGGRLLALRWILEGPPELLGEKGLLERQNLLVKYPKYAELADEAAKVRAALAARPAVDDAPQARRDQATELADLAAISQHQELILHEIAVRREPAEMVFPPLRKTKEVQEALPEGHVLLAFFATSRNLYAFLYSREKYAAWQIHSPAVLQKQIGTLLREMGNFDGNHQLTSNELSKSAWQATAVKVMSLLLEKSNVDLAGNFQEIAIVPDGMLWYLPFEALSVGKGQRAKPLIYQAQVRYAPTVGLAVPYSRAQKPRPSTGVVAGKLHPQDDEAVAAAAVEELGRWVEGAVALPRTLPAASSVYRTLFDGLIVLDEIEPGEGPYDWSPAQLDRGKPGSSLASWFPLPWGGPERVILPGFHTAAENGLRRGQASGNELFLSLCGLMSCGARTVLISRWRTAGQSSLDLVREFAQELPHTSAAEAWQRSVQITADNSLDVDHEPRLKTTSAAGEPPKAGHPFFWAGYMLVDSGVVPAGQDAALALPGLGAPAKGVRPQLANPPLARDVPGADPGPDVEEPPRRAPAAGKRAAKAKPMPRVVPQKAPPRKKAVAADGDES